MTPLWKAKNYNEFLNNYLHALPKAGHGASIKMAAALHMHSTLFSQVLRGKRDFTLEQAALFCDHIGLAELESELFLKSVELARAGNESLRKKLERQIVRLRAQFQEVGSRVAPDANQLSESEKAIFYSSWQYSALRMLCSTPRDWSSEKLATALGLPLKRVREAVLFLVSKGLLLEKKGRLTIGPASTHIEANSPWVTRHHINWRLRHLERVEKLESEELCFTAPFSCTEADFKKIREILLSAIEEVSSTVKESGSDAVYTICLDLFKAFAPGEKEKNRAAEVRGGPGAQRYQ